MNNNSRIKPAIGILWARPIERPSFIPVSRPRGAKAAGLRYERQLAKYLKPLGCIHGQWFEFEDRSGIRYCQTDLIYPVRRRLFAVLEVKYTLVEHAYDQLLDVYGPVVEAAYATPVGLVTVYKNKRTVIDEPSLGPSMPFEDIPTAAQFSYDTGTVSLLHWVGQRLTPKPNDRIESILREIDSSQSARARAPHPLVTH